MRGELLGPKDSEDVRRAGITVSTSVACKKSLDAPDSSNTGLKSDNISLFGLIITSSSIIDKRRSGTIRAFGYYALLLYSSTHFRQPGTSAQVPEV